MRSVTSLKLKIFTCHSNLDMYLYLRHGKKSNIPPPPLSPKNNRTGSIYTKPLHWWTMTESIKSTMIYIYHSSPCEKPKPTMIICPKLDPTWSNQESGPVSVLHSRLQLHVTCCRREWNKSPVLYNVIVCNLSNLCLLCDRKESGQCILKAYLRNWWWACRR